MNVFGKFLNWIGRGSGSPTGEVNTKDAVKSLRTAAITAVAMAIIQFAGDVSRMDLGPYGMVALPLLSGAVDYVRRWVTDNAK